MDGPRGRATATSPRVELFEAHAARIAERDPAINALVLPRLDEAREEAVAADAALARGEAVGALHGVPFTAKDPLAVAGMRAPNGSKLLADHVERHGLRAGRAHARRGRDPARQDQRVRVRDVVGLGQRAVRRDREPARPTRTAGGSSGGEAAAIASGMSPLGLGSDLGGSIRNPCHFVGLFGLKPGRDTVPFAEHAPLPAAPGVRLMGVVGPMARSADDLDARARGAGRRGSPPPARPRRVAVTRRTGSSRCQRDCRAAVRRAAAALADAGYELVEAAPPNAAEVRGAFDLTARDGDGDGAARGRRRAASTSCRPTCTRCSRPPRRFRPDWAAYFQASGGSRAARTRPTRWFAQHPVALCPAAPEVAPPLRGAWSARSTACRRNPGGKLTLATYASALGLPGGLRPGHARRGAAASPSAFS